MELNLTRPLCFFDLETTGTNVAKDRIVEISILKVYPNGNRESRTWLVNPEMEIPKEAEAVHKISNERVADEPTFRQLAPVINEMIKGCDLAGYNSDRFDIPLLAEEMLRAGIDFDLQNTLAIDVQTIFHKMEQRTLAAAYKFYCGKELLGAHSAEADTIATYEVLKSQLDRYPELENNAKWLASFSERVPCADAAGLISFDKAGKEIFNFGKYKGKCVEDIFDQEPGYFSWIQAGDFPEYSKKVFTAIKLRRMNTKVR